jgi:hypothetical protein
MDFPPPNRVPRPINTAGVVASGLTMRQHCGESFLRRRRRHLHHFKTTVPIAAAQ